jgi:hypothetical protein
MLAPEFLHTTVPLGHLSAGGEFQAIGAGVILSSREFAWIVTARHVHGGGAAADHDLVAIGTAQDGTQFPILIAGALGPAGLDWIFSDVETDLAIAPMPLSPEWRLRAIPPELTLKTSALVPAMPSYTLGVPYGLATLNPDRLEALVLDGVIAGVDPARAGFYTSAPTFPGNSGGPVFVYRTPFNVQGGLQVGVPPVLLAGIVLRQELIVPQMTGAVGFPDVPLHLGFVRGIERAYALLDSADAQPTLARLREIAQQEQGIRSP